ncbi:PREDICTED: uncharacterized protein LOC104820908 [Tarenaya hassleriana]|uniref:uncharacterized protein LOC104820908 n=1 Tax=Tarenaya hassleriana TaxID=28532 RepID=UPI00053C72BA|nr:PREDICTED: uncharacterized protein LOC104820908 [Tarenaya hassleriana]
MSQLCHNLTVFPAESDTESADLDHVPLAVRRRLLLSRDRVHGCAQRTHATESTSKVDIAVKKEDDSSNFLELRVKENEHDMESSGDALETVVTEISEESAGVGCCQEMVSSGVAKETAVTRISESAEVGCSKYIGDFGNLKACDDILACNNAREDSSRIGKVEENLGHDDLEHITLKERRKILLQRMTLTSGKPHIEGCSEESSEACDESNLYKIKTELSKENGIASFSGSQFSGFLEKIDSILCKSISIGSESESQPSGTQEGNDSIVKEQPCNGSPEGSLFGFSDADYGYSLLASNGHAAAGKRLRISVKNTEKDSPSVKTSDIHGSVLQNYLQVKLEPSDSWPVQDIHGKIPGNFEQVQVKRETETPDGNDIDCMKLSSRISSVPAQNPLDSVEHVIVKTEAETSHEIDEDELDNMKLCDRMKLLASSHKSTSCYTSGEDLYSFSDFILPSSENIKPLRMLRTRKRKKTATNSIETALEEDAPGLLQVLLNQGVLVDELKLYGETDCFDDLNDSLIEESFSELEAIMSQLFFKRETCTKLLPLRCTKSSRSSYCLTCLFALVEQARYLRFRKWPVEWGWCRDLQSFIFVFERHKRIVMERPEYGFATYFFELADTSPIGWQIKRLVTTMKLAGCGRNALIENKPLLVGEDLSEGEAQVLTKYGWLPNTGLATMLHYRDRVFHDRKNEKESSEWRSKICKLLVEGYAGGTIVSNTVADKETGDDVLIQPLAQVKPELCLD